MTIEWNKVTWYSKVVAVVLFVGVFYLGFWLGEQSAEVRSVATVVEIDNTDTLVVDKSDIDITQDGEYCFVRSQVATTGAPYNVEENIKIRVAGDVVSGTKFGTQSGPDMTNGYTGTLIGEYINDEYQLIFEYEIEGSMGKESEIYKADGTDLVKYRYVLIDKGDILVPDRSSSPTLQAYKNVDCR